MGLNAKHLKYGQLGPNADQITLLQDTLFWNTTPSMGIAVGRGNHPISGGGEWSQTTPATYNPPGQLATDNPTDATFLLPASATAVTINPS